MILKTSKDRDLLPLKKLIISKTKEAGKNVRNLRLNQTDRKSFPAPGYSESSTVPLAILSRRKPAFAYEAIS